MAGSESTNDLKSAAILRGRMALEALKSREQAALFHAAHADLQVALFEAESGNDQSLQRWLLQYRSLMEGEPDLQQHLASVQSTLSQTEQDVSPWPAMIVGAHQRANGHVENRVNFENLPVAEVAKTVEESLPNSKVLSTPTTEVKKENAAFVSANIAGPLLIPALLQVSRNQDNKPTFKKKWAWLSSALLGSMAAHFIALTVMSAYVIHMVRNPEPKAIIASTIESETISMEAPMELSTSDSPTLDPSDTPMPTLPTFAAVSAASSDMHLPSSMTGLITSDASSPSDNAIQKATNNSPMSNSVANSVQFFGVKAAGNTFCYVVDVSPSMKKDGAFAAAKAELVRSLALLKPKQRFFISFFGGEIERLKLGGRDEELYPIYATPENLQKSLIWIDRVRLQEKGLPPNNALKEAILMDPDGIFLLFDGDTKVDVAAYLRKANRSDDLISGGTPLVPIHTIGFYTQEFESLMIRIAKENNGVYRFVPKPLKPR